MSCCGSSILLHNLVLVMQYGFDGMVVVWCNVRGRLCCGTDGGIVRFPLVCLVAVAWNQ